MLKQLISLLNNAPDDIVEQRYLAQDNFPFLLKASYNKVIEDFKRRFMFKGKFDIEQNHQDNIFMDHASQIDLQVFDFIIGDYAVDCLQEKYNMSISLHNNAVNRTPTRNPSQVMVEAINAVGAYILENNLPFFLPYHEFNLRTGLPKQWTIPKGLEKFIGPD